VEKRLEPPLRKAIDWLETHGYRYAVIGGLEELLIAHRGKLDEAYVENWLAQFAEALEKPEILTEYYRLLAQSKSLE
jgi:predicted HAD superfamily phosphohydrolase YqeG